MFDRYIVDANGCHVFQGSLNRQGYAQARINGKLYRLSRVVLERKTGVVGEIAAHSCDNPSCINPDHLRWVTQSENVQEMFAKGRRAGSTGLLTDAEVLEVRRLYAAGDVTQQQLAVRFNKSRSVIGRAIRGQQPAITYTA